MASAAEQLAANLNFGVFAKATELKKRIWFTLAALVVYRLGTWIPVPGIDPHILAEVFRRSGGGILGMFDMFAGGALQRMTIFALNIMPYISASIVIQLLTTMVPSFDALKKEGEQGRKKLNQYTRYGTVGLAMVQDALGHARLAELAHGDDDPKVHRRPRNPGAGRASLCDMRDAGIPDDDPCDILRIVGALRHRHRKARGL